MFFNQPTCTFPVHKASLKGISYPLKWWRCRVPPPSPLHLFHLPFSIIVNLATDDDIIGKIFPFVQRIFYFMLNGIPNTTRKIVFGITGTRTNGLFICPETARSANNISLGRAIKRGVHPGFHFHNQFTNFPIFQ